MMKDEILAQKERVKQMSRWERFKYFWYYQWKWVALAVAVIAFLCYLGFTIYKNSFEEYVYVALVNCDITKSQQSQELMEGYAGSRNVDTSQTPASINTKLSIPEEATGSLSVANSQTLQAYIETGDYDVLIGNTWIIDDFASQGYLCDLNVVRSDFRAHHFSSKVGNLRAKPLHFRGAYGKIRLHGKSYRLLAPDRR